MSTEFHSDDSGLRRYRVSLIIGLVLAGSVLFSLLGYWAWKKFGPFAEYRQANRDAKETLSIAQKRPLTQEEFTRTLQLLESDESTPNSLQSQLFKGRPNGTPHSKRPCWKRCFAAKPPRKIRKLPNRLVPLRRI